VEHRRNTQPGVFYQRFLQPVQRLYAFCRADHVRAERTGDLPGAKCQLLFQRLTLFVTGKIIAQIGTFFVIAVAVEDQPERMHLREFFLRRHACQKIGDAAGNGL